MPIFRTTLNHQVVQVSSVDGFAKWLYSKNKSIPYTTKNDKGEQEEYAFIWDYEQFKNSQTEKALPVKLPIGLQRDNQKKT